MWKFRHISLFHIRNIYILHTNECMHIQCYKSSHSISELLADINSINILAILVCTYISFTWPYNTTFYVAYVDGSLGWTDIRLVSLCNLNLCFFKMSCFHDRGKYLGRSKLCQNKCPVKKYCQINTCIKCGNTINLTNEWTQSEIQQPVASPPLGLLGL